MKQRLVVVGNGMAGMRVVEEVLSAAPDMFEITVFGSEPHGNYNRIMLSPVLSGEKTLGEIMINDHQWYQDNHINLNAGIHNEVVEIDRNRREVVTLSGARTGYDRLLLATGSRPFVLPIPGNDLDGVLSFRDISDVEKMLEYSRTHKHAVVLGGGLLGLEAAYGLVQRGMDVTVIHSRDILLNRQLDREAAKLLQAELAGRGVKFKMPAQTEEILANDQQHVRAVRFADGVELPCDLFVMAIGIRPNITLAKASGLYCEQGVVVDDTLQTYDPTVYAVGECIQHRGQTFGLVAPLFDQAKVCANHLSQHGVAEYQTLPTATKLKVSGINLFSVGDFQGGEATESLLWRDHAQKYYKKIVLKHNQVVGAVLYGDTAEGGWYQQLLEDKTDITQARHFLIFGRAYAESRLLTATQHAEVSTEVA